MGSQLARKKKALTTDKMPFKTVPKQSFSERMGAKVGKISETPNRFKEKAKNIKEQAKEMPVHAQYALVMGMNKLKETVKGFKRGVEQQKQGERTSREDSAEQKR